MPDPSSLDPKWGQPDGTHDPWVLAHFQALESDSMEVPYWHDLVEWNGHIYKDGYLEIPNKPGLGVELNEHVCRKHLAEGSGYFE